MSYMLDEIRQQPGVMLKALGSSRPVVLALSGELAKRDIRFVILAARGTSDNAAVFAKYLIECVNGLPCALAAPSIVTLYDVELRLDKALVIGISQSGKATDVVEYVTRARKMGAVTAAITNEPDSPLACSVDHALLCNAGIERSVAATKTYTATLACLYTLSAQMSREEGT